ncbi:hypothetical protein [Piscinibacter terrae]|uniref:Uncharacterized protein n=1 Tax=Piscinibacter terrae TaxID=2496871 RepID=A0A3N7HMF1_9BURK|nr:hypothetical protein [Albitalea terrae]RQP23264.1 hypothetical protein DZC73_19360 [Albitalea terrae]
MIAATFMNMSNTPAAHRARPVSLQVAMLAQQAVRDEPTATDVMVYRQPLSDVPVPSSWRPSKPVPLDSVDVPCEGPESLRYDDEMVGWDSAGVSLARLHHLERETGPRRIADRQRAERFNTSLIFIFAAVTCSVIGWVVLL